MIGLQDASQTLLPHFSLIHSTVHKSSVEDLKRRAIWMFSDVKQKNKTKQYFGEAESVLFAIVCNCYLMKHVYQQGRVSVPAEQDQVPFFLYM